MIDREREKAIESFISIDRLHRTLFDGAVRNMGLHRGQHHVLMWLSRTDCIPSQKDIAERLEVSPAAVAVMLGKLEQAGYIERSADDADRRNNRTSITPKGREAVEKTHRVFSEIDSLMFAGLSEEELRKSSDVLGKMAENLRNINVSELEAGGDRP